VVHVVEGRPSRGEGRVSCQVSCGVAVKEFCMYGRFGSDLLSACSSYALNQLPSDELEV